MYNLDNSYVDDKHSDDDQDSGGYRPLINVDDLQLDVDQVVSHLPRDLLELSPEQESTSTGATPENERTNNVIIMR